MSFTGFSLEFIDDLNK